MSQHGSQFIHDRNQQFHASDEVSHVVDFLRTRGEQIPNQPADKISAYLGFLADRDYVNDGILTGDETSIGRQIDAYVINAEDVPNSYFELQRRIAREQGHGDIQITPEMRRQMTEAVQADQRAGLSKWVEYLGGDDGGYPNWFKHYIWTSITKLGMFDKGKQEFQKRSRGTTAAYPELNREALAYVYDALNKSRVEGELVHGGANDEKLQKLLKSGNFGKLYAHAVLEVTPDSPELRSETRGSWTKFNQTDDPRTARRLAGSLQGHGTGWCTAGESTASIQLEGGDFYVYYTRDEDGKDSVPRIAIRMEQGKVAEVRGVNTAQELEPEMAGITAEQLKDLPGGEEYIIKAEDMKRLTSLEKKITANSDVELTNEELRFLYELDREVQGFGYERDPRVSEIRKLRGERDKPELVRVLPEAIRGQVQSAYAAYKSVIEQLGGKQKLFRKNETAISPRELEQLFGQKDQDWQDNGVYDYLVEQLIEDGARFNLVITPNIAVTEEQIVALAEAFGEGQPYPTTVYSAIYRRGNYTDQEWSGNAGSESVQFSLISSKYDQDLGYNPAPEQARLLQEKQARQPKLGFRVPSVLTAITHWYALRARGDKLDDSSAFDKAYTRHFDMDPRRVSGWARVPYSLVDDGGSPRLVGNDAEYDDFARLAVG